MTPRAVYATLVDRVFGNGSATFDSNSATTNNVIGALANASNFSDFKQNFEARLHRLNAATQQNATLKPETLAAVNRVVHSGWDGAYAELCALDYFLAAPATGPSNVVLDHTGSAKTTLASEMGMQEANHDMRFADLGVSMDTKLLSDKTGQILDGIFCDFRSQKGINSLTIIPSYDLGSEFNQYSQNRNALLKELVTEIDPVAQPSRFNSCIIPDLSYTFAWQSGVHFGESTYSPEKHAQNHHKLLFGHAKKFSRNEPSLITLVHFPWSGEKLFPIDDCIPTFFRMLGQHFFNDYINTADLAKSFNKKITTNISAGEVSKHLSGLVYLEDTCITGTDPNALNVNASYLWNANALHTLSNHDLEKSLRDRGACNLNQ